MRKLSLILIIIFASIFITSNLFAIGKSKQRVLVLQSYHYGLSWTEKISEGIQTVLQKAKDKGVELEIDYEYMDTKRFVDESYYKMLYNIYKFKSRRLKYDVIISADDNALNFLLKHRNDIFGNVPVVFCGVNHFEDNRIKGKKNYTGVVEAFDVKSTLDIALKQFPNTKEFVIVGDNTTTSILDRKTVKEVTPLYEKRGIKFTYYKDADVMKYQRDLQNLKAGSVVIAMHFNRDTDGKFYAYEDSFVVYTLNIKVPVYTFWDFYLNRGALGGMIISGQSQGEEAAKKALQILQGQKLKNIPIMLKSPNKYMFDYKIFKEFNLGISDLPDESIVINRPANFMDLYRRYKRIIGGILILVVFLFGVIVLLSFNILKRKKVEKKLIETNIAYDRFVPHTLLDHLQKESITDVHLGDQIEKEMTILFSDIRAFTSLSESMTPEENFNFINSFLKIVSPIIRNYNGFIDKYIGDAIMALFPEKAEDAVLTAVEMHKQVIDFNIKREKKGKQKISIGIGVHIGKLMLGTVGEEQRMEGTVISDAVNLSARLEGLTKLYGANIIISEETLENLGESKVKYIYRYLGQVSVKGKKDSVSIYEIIDGNESDIAEHKIKTKKIFENGISHFYNKDFEAAIQKFQNVIKLNSQDKAARRYLKKSENLNQKELPDDWDGVEKFDVK